MWGRRTARLWSDAGTYNARVLAWIFDRCAGMVGASGTPIGFLPNQDDLDVEGLEIDPAGLAELIVARLPLGVVRCRSSTCTLPNSLIGSRTNSAISLRL